MSIALMICVGVLAALTVFLLVLMSIRHWTRRQYTKLHGIRNPKEKLVIGFFHPFCHSGGGGERVLWCFIHVLLHQMNTKQKLKLIIYTSDVATSSIQEILQRVKSRFNLDISTVEVSFHPLKHTHLLLPRTYPRCTLFLQSLGSMIVGFQALWDCPCDIYIDTTGFAFTIFLAKFVFQTQRTVAYVHYPTISTDMISSVKDQTPGLVHNSNDKVVRSLVLSGLKVYYYRACAYVYGFVGHSSVDVVMVNSSWTKRHVQQLWQPRVVHVVYPPCPTEALVKDLQVMI